MEDSVKASVEDILTAYLEQNNHRKTPERFAVLDAVYSIDGHFTLDELSDKLRRESRFPVSRATLYNTLKLFMELGLVVCHRLNGGTMYEACYGSKCHCHQVCTVCGKITELKVPGIEKSIDELRLRRFRKDGFSLYLYGICSGCMAKGSRRKVNKENIKSQKNKENE
ncbi:MAG: transcriptional repressor [Prevotella sp.]|nr:transcriptional repressor [Prevotella sp.]